VEHILSTYPPEDVAYAGECLQANGGVDRLFLSYYQHGEGGEIPEAQVFRLEGPSAVFYFRGFPHVHAFLNVAMDGDAPLSVGEPLGNNPSWLDHAGVKSLFETALLAQTGSDLAFYNEGSVAGRLRPGVIRAGDIYSLESWQETSEVVEIRGSSLSPTLQAELRKRQIVMQSEKIYTVATTVYAASDLGEKLGRIGSRRSGPMLRDLVIAYLRSNGFPREL
jgi:5'-nucleotidase, C-terminal domain